MIARVVRFLDDRLAGASLVRKAFKRVFPDHWSFLLGEIALYAFIVVCITGVYLAFFYRPGVAQVVYDGPYEPLRGVQMNEAFESVLRLSFEVPGGLLMRQMHRWGVLVFIGAVFLHLLRVFFTGAFRRPREINWMIGLTMLIVAIITAFSGYSLPHDLLSGVGLRVAYSLILSVPVIGTWLVGLVFGGEFVEARMLSRLYFLHILVLPGILAALLAAHMGVLVRQKHTQFPGRGRTERNVVGHRLWPTYAGKTVGLFLLVFSFIALLGGVIQINPVWIYGPFEPWFLTTPAQPDWYLGWIEGALRLFPPWELELFGYLIPNPFFPAVLLPALTFGTLYAWPFLEARISGDRNRHELLDRPREHPVRTAVGCGALSFYALLLIAGSNDLIASTLGVQVIAVTHTLRALVLIVPPVVGFATYRICKELVRNETRRSQQQRIEQEREPTA